MKTDDFYLKGLEGRDQMDSSFGDSGEGHHESNSQHETKYQCILKCEGSKTYHKPGFCPDCNVKLVLVVDNKHQL